MSVSAHFPPHDDASSVTIADLASLFDVAVVTGKSDKALAAFTLSWPDLAAEHGERLRELLDRLPSSTWENDAWIVCGYASSYRTIRPTSRSAALPYFAASLAAVDDSTPAIAVAGIRLRLAATLRSLGRMQAALHEVNESVTAVASAPASLPNRVKVEGLAALQRGMCQFHLGDYDAARENLLLADGLARDHFSPAAQVECCGTLAMIEYTRGDFHSATEHAENARAAAQGSELLQSQFGSAALIAELLMAIERNHVDEAIGLADEVATASRRSDWEPLGLYAQGAVSVIDERYVVGLDLVSRCVKTARLWDSRGAVITMAEGLRGILLLRLGETDTAWDILAGLVPTQNHANCPARFVAHLRLSTGDAAGALAALRDCELLGDDHSTRSLVDVLLIKSAAHYLLGNLTVSDVSFDRGLIIVARNDMRIPFKLVPHSAIGSLVQRAATRTQPDDVKALLEPGWDDHFSSAALSPETLLLTERERDIVRSLAHHNRVSDIAEQLFISVNTVKTHLKSIHRKLGVSSRPDLLKKARELGLHLEITHK